MFLNELVTCINAMVPLLYLLGYEENRYIDLIKQTQNNIFIWDINNGLNKKDGGDRTTPLGILEYINDPSSSSGVYILLDFHVFIENTNIIRMLKEITTESSFKGRKSIVVISAVKNIPQELNRSFVLIEASLPGSREIYSNLVKTVEGLLEAGIINKTFSNRNELLKVITVLKGLTLNQIDVVLARSITAKNKIDYNYIKEIKQKQILTNSLLEIINTDTETGLKDIGGMSILKEWLSVREPVFKSPHVSAEIPVPRGIIISGIQGCGKSGTARSLAKDWNLPLISFDLGRIYGSRIGESEQQMRQSLKIVESLAPCILFIDEFEKAFSGVQSSGLTDGGTSARIFGYFLSWLQDHKSHIFIVATTNNIQLLPPEILRKGRFDEIFFVDLPNVNELEEIYLIHLNKMKKKHLIASCRTFASLSKGFSGAEVKQTIINAIYYAYSKKRELNRGDIINQINKTIPLSITRSEDVINAREWAEGRCIFVNELIKSETRILDFSDIRLRVVDA